MQADKDNVTLMRVREMKQCLYFNAAPPDVLKLKGDLYTGTVQCSYKIPSEDEIGILLSDHVASSDSMPRDGPLAAVLDFIAACERVKKLLHDRVRETEIPETHDDLDEMPPLI